MIDGDSSAMNDTFYVKSNSGKITSSEQQAALTNAVQVLLSSMGTSAGSLVARPNFEARDKHSTVATLMGTARTGPA
jgi:hypothetical protein